MAGFAYLDSSAMAKLLLPERESRALEAAILEKDGLFSSGLSVAECGRALMRAGFGKRLMFGSDQMVWPEGIGMAIEGIESAGFLTPEQKRDIFYNNAVRFLRLDEKKLGLNSSK